jgi:hypothetical protein
MNLCYSTGRRGRDSAPASSFQALPLHGSHKIPTNHYTTLLSKILPIGDKQTLLGRLLESRLEKTIQTAFQNICAQLTPKHIRDFHIEKFLMVNNSECGPKHFPKFFTNMVFLHYELAGTN